MEVNKGIFNIEPCTHYKVKVTNLMGGKLKTVFLPLKDIIVKQEGKS